MPEVNTDKIFAAFLLRLEEVAQIEDFDDIEKEFLGKNSLLSEERKSLSSLNEVSRKNMENCFKIFQIISPQN